MMKMQDTKNYHHMGLVLIRIIYAYHDKYFHECIAHYALPVMHRSSQSWKVYQLNKADIESNIVVELSTQTEEHGHWNIYFNGIVL